MRPTPTRAGLALLLLPLGGCGAFATRAEPFTPDAPPVSEVVATGRDTAYVVRTPAYVLRTRDRALLWNRGALDDAAWRYRWLFGRTPSPIAVRLDTSTTAAPTPSGAADGAALPSVTVQVPASASASAPGGGALALRVARAWLGAGADTTAARLPWWFEAGALRILADGGGAPRARGDDPAPVATLLAAARPASDSLARVLVARAAGSPDGRARRVASRGAGGPSVAADAASLLAFLRERDPALVARLPEALRAGRTLPELLGGAKLPATVDGLDAEWRRWLRRRPADARAFGAGA